MRTQLVLSAVEIWGFEAHTGKYSAQSGISEAVMVDLGPDSVLLITDEHSTYVF